MDVPLNSAADVINVLKELIFELSKKNVNLKNAKLTLNDDAESAELDTSKSPHKLMYSSLDRELTLVVRIGKPKT